jgi:hypothetical protein
MRQVFESGIEKIFAIKLIFKAHLTFAITSLSLGII